MRSRALFLGLSLVVAASCTVYAGCGSESGNTVDLGDAGTVVLSVDPSSATKVVGETQTFVARATHSSGADADVGRYITWSSSDAEVASIDAKTGVATALRAGRTTISARVDNLVATAELTVLGKEAAPTDAAGDAPVDAPQDVAVDAPLDASDAGAFTRLFVSNLGSESAPSILVFETTAQGDVAPLRTIKGANTQLSAPSQMAMVGNELYVADGGFRGILVFAANANGDVAPLRSIKGSNTTFTNFSPTGVIPHGAALFVTDQLNGLLEFPLNGSGNIAPTRVVSSFIYANHGTNTPIANEVMVAIGSPTTASGFLVSPVDAGSNALRVLDAGHNGARGIYSTPSTIYVATSGGTISKTVDDAIVAFSATAQSGAAPLRTIAGTTNTGLHDPHGVGVYGGEIYVANQQEQAVRVWPEAANGDVAPARVIKGAATGFAFPAGLLIAPAP